MFVKGHKIRGGGRKSEDRLTRFERFVMPEPNSGCWLWTGHITPAGYGQFSWGHENPRRAHRAAWELYRAEIPAEMWIMHKCDNRSCVNPDHLRLGTPEQNVHDMLRKGRGNFSKGVNHYKVRALDKKMITDIRAYIGPASDMATKYGLSMGKVYRIKSGITGRGLVDG